MIAATRGPTRIPQGPGDIKRPGAVNGFGEVFRIEGRAITAAREPRGVNLDLHRDGRAKPAQEALCSGATTTIGPRRHTSKSG
jgi:hypothetical protein